MDIRDEELQTIFSTYGQVVDVKVIDGKPVGTQKCAFIGYADQTSAKTAIELLSNVYKFRPNAEKPIRVEFTKGGGGAGGGGGGGGGRDDYSGGRGSWSGGSADWSGSSDRGWNDRSSQSQSQGDGEESRKVFVGQLPMDITEEEMNMVFRTYGEVVSVHIMDGKPVGSNKVAFVEYATPSQCQTAISALNDEYRFRRDAEQPIRVSQKKAQNRDKGGGKGDHGGSKGWEDRGGGGWRDGGRDQGGGGKGGSGHSGPPDRPPGPKLHIGNLPTDLTREALETVFGTYGAIKDIHLMQKNDGGQGAAFVTYEQEHDARRAVAAMEQGYEIRPGQGNINVSYAKAKQDGGGKGDRYRPY